MAWLHVTHVLDMVHFLHKALLMSNGNLNSISVKLVSSVSILCHVRKKGSPVHVAPTYIGSGEWFDHFRSYVHSLSLHFCKRLFLGLEIMTSGSQGNSFTAALGLPSSINI
jgi:hypothetical protein